MASFTIDTVATSEISSPFMSLPGELRNAIYHHHFETIFIEQGLENNAVCKPVEASKPALSLLSTSRAIKNEASSIFWVEYVPRCHWGLGARHDDDDRATKFCEAVRKYTSRVLITFQKRSLHVASMDTNLVWLVLHSDSYLSSDDQALQKFREEWQSKHQIPGGFVWMKSIDLPSCDSAIVFKYTHHPGERSWVQFRGHLAMLDWRNIFASEEAGAKISP